MLPDGYKMYRDCAVHQIGCNALPALRDHALYLGDIFRAVSESCLVSKDTEEEWTRAEAWLHLAARLEYVHVNAHFTRIDGDYMCGADYERELSDSLSQYMTEHTRLLYLFYALERLIDSFKLPPLPKHNGLANRGTHLLMTSDIEVQDHYTCVLRNLERALAASMERDNTQLTDKLRTNEYRATNGLLLAVANQVRNIASHGESDNFEPIDWGGTLRSDRVTPELALTMFSSRGILLTIPLLILAKRPDFVSAHLTSLPIDEVAVYANGGWVDTAVDAATVETLLQQAHRGGLRLYRFL